METKYEDKKHPRFTLQGDKFAKVDALSKAYIEANKAAREMMKAASEQLWDGIKAECEGIDLEDGNYCLNREYSDDGILFVEPGDCDCPVHVLLGGKLPEGMRVKSGSLTSLLADILGAGGPDDGEEAPPKDKTH